jgi:hypothetical protein
VIEAEPSLMALEGVDFRFWHEAAVPPVSSNFRC